MDPWEKTVIIIIGAIAFLFIFSNFLFKMVELAYVMRRKKPLYVHRYWRLRKLTEEQARVLRQRFRFYNKLSRRQQRYFEHRMHLFIKDKDFIGREGLNISDEIQVLSSATAIMLTFGFRDFYIPLLEKIIIYPDSFYSKMNNSYHKGEFNPKLKAIVLSWKDFEQGYDVPDDNLNLGIHEFTHAIHLNGIQARDISANIFQDGFKALTRMLSNDENMKTRLIDSQYFRDYAYTNQYEFLAVVVENFIESPAEFRNQFPRVYDHVKQMLNFNFAGY